MDEQSQADSSIEDRLSAFLTPEAAPEAEATQDAEPPQVEATAPEEQPAPEPAPEGEAFEIDGEQYILPPKLHAKVKELQDGALMRTDYTQKSQALAELTRQATAISEALQRQQHFDQQVASERNELAVVKHRLNEFKSINWADLSVEQHLSLRQQMETLKDKAGDLETSIKGKEREFDTWKQSKHREALDSGQKYLAQTIKGWGPEAAKEVTSAAMDVGFTTQELETVVDPRFVRLAWEAAQYRKLQASKPTAVAAAKKAPPILKPGASMGQRASQDAQYKDMRTTLKKSGSMDDAARLLSKF